MRDDNAVPKVVRRERAATPAECLAEPKGLVMKTFLLGGIACVVLAAGPASAADMPIKAVPKVQPSAYNWTGCYLGIHGGGGVLYAGWNGQNGVGGLAGGQAGCNYQAGPIVVGVEAEGWWSGLTS